MSSFIRQSVYLSGVLVYFSQTNCHLVGGLKLTYLRCQMLHQNMKGIIARSLYGLIFLLWNFLECSRNWATLYKNTCYKFFTIISFALLQSKRFNLNVYFRLFCQTTVVEMPSLNRYEKITCNNCGTQPTKLNLARHKTSCSVGTLFCSQCPNFSTKSRTI